MNGAAYWQADPKPGPRIPVAKPRLPSAEAILPYLRQIDASRWYSNGGPLNAMLQERLQSHTGARHVVCGANGTLGLALALLAQGVRRTSLCLVPAWTFAASAHAAMLAGLVPWLVDVDPKTHQLTPGAVKALLPKAPGPVGAVMPVMPFGSPMDAAAWDAFKAETGLAVVIDAAAGFDTVRASHVPTVVSLHATKVLGIGEGCLVASNDTALIERVVQLANFGFWNTREALVPALNAKLSEYGAAVGLAAIADWPRTRADFVRVGNDYRRLLPQAAGVEVQTGFAQAWIASTVMVSLPAGTMAQTLAALSEAGIGVRRWWGGGLHRHAAFATCPRTALPITDLLVETQLGLPCWPDLPDEQIGYICRTIAAATQRPLAPTA
jgi:dTDP-4-amino-4,6-dideoxygalactose transaminase